MSKKKKPRGNKVLLGVCVLVLCVLGFLIYSMGITETPFEAAEKQEGGEIVTGAETSEAPETGSGVQFTGNLIYGERINKEDILHIFNRTLEERRRLVIEGSFEQPVTFVLLQEFYYNNWLRERIVKTHRGYIKEPAEEFSIRTDINENAGGVYYFIVQSQENEIRGEIKVFEVAKL